VWGGGWEGYCMCVCLCVYGRERISSKERMSSKRAKATEKKRKREQETVFLTSLYGVVV